jgi:hypothetical protein
MENKKVTEANANIDKKLNKVKEKKKLFSLKAMEEFVDRNQFLNDKYNKLEYYGKDLFGYHYNEVIMNIIFNKYVMGNKKLKAQYRAIADDFLKESSTTAGHGGTGGGSGQYSTPVAFQKGKFMNNTWKEMGEETPKGVKKTPYLPKGSKLVNTNKLKLNGGKGYFVSGLSNSLNENLLNNPDLLMEYLETQITDRLINDIREISLDIYPVNFGEVEMENDIYFVLRNDSNSYYKITANYNDLKEEVDEIYEINDRTIYDDENDETYQEENFDYDQIDMDDIIKAYIFKNQNKIEIADEEELLESFVKEHHIETRENKITFILSNTEDYTETELNNKDDEELNNIYKELESGVFDKLDGKTILADVKTEEDCNECDNRLSESDIKHPQMIKLDRLHNENEKGSKEYYNNLNKGVQDMIDDKKDAKFKYDYDKDSMKPNDIPKNRMSKEDQEHVDLLRFGVEDIEFDVEPNQAYMDRIKKEMGDERFERMMKRKEYIKKKGLNTRYPKEAVPVKVVSENINNTVYGAYTNALNKRDIISFNINEAKSIDTTNDNLYKIHVDGYGNDKPNLINVLNENYFYTDYNKNIYTIKKEKVDKININENEKLEKISKLINYNPNDWIDRRKNLKG